jgi:hypothetical protein
MKSGVWEGNKVERALARLSVSRRRDDFFIGDSYFIIIIIVIVEK